LTIETILVAGSDGDVPVSFGFHPYFGLPDFPRAQWRLKLPAMRRMMLDARGIPTGAEVPFDGLDAELGELAFDDGFALMAEQGSFSVAGAGRRITVDFLEGYTHAQVYAPKGNDYIAFEPMTAPTSALTTGHGLRLVKAGEQFRAAFRIRVEASQNK
jgi:aldose 1-epimerase